MLYFNEKTIENQSLIKSVLQASGLSFLQGEISRLTGGSKSYAFQVNDYVVRFPKAEIIFQSLQQESEISGLLQKNLSPRWQDKVTKVCCCAQIDYPFAYHKWIKGKICDNLRGETEHNTCYNNLSDEQKTYFAADVADFLTELHTIKSSATNPMAENWNFLNKEDFDYKLCRNLLHKYSHKQIDLDNFATNISDNNFVFAHNDMSGSNLAVDENQTHILQGILDFGNAGFMPLINEFFPYYKINRRLARQIILSYNKKSRQQINLQKTDYIALAYCGYFLCQTEKQEKPPFRFILSILENFAADLQLNKEK